MKYFSGFLFSYQIISHVASAEPNVCVALVYYMHVLSTVFALGFHILLFFTSTVDELNAVLHSCSYNTY